MARAMTLHAFLTFASDAEIAALWGGGLLTFAVFAWLADMRRIKRARIDRVGWVPWTAIFLACAVAGLSLLALVAKGLLAG